MRAARGGVKRLSIGVVSMGTLSMAFAGDEQPDWDVVVTNASAVSGYYHFFVSVNGGPYALTVLGPSVLGSLTHYQTGPVLVIGQVIRVYLDLVDSQGELLATSNRVQGTVS
jgi:hypothetical protein